MKWDNVQKEPKDIDHRELHYVKVEPNHIMIDFDVKGEDGKSGSGIHLDYIYTGDPELIKYSFE